MDPFCLLFEATCRVGLFLSSSSQKASKMDRVEPWDEASSTCALQKVSTGTCRASQAVDGNARVVPAKSPYGAPALFQKKHDGTLHMCVDYRALNFVPLLAVWVLM